MTVFSPLSSSLMIRLSAPLFALVIAGCQPSTEESAAATTETVSTGTVSAPVAETALARVNQVTISDEDLAFAINRTFSQSDLLQANQELAEKVLQSLVAGEAMQQKLIAELSDAEQQALRQQVKAYEQELYVKEYLARYATAEPVTAAMVEAYYQQNPQQFGAKTVKQFQLLSSQQGVDEQQRQTLLEQQALIAQNEDWSGLVKQLPVALNLQQGRSDGGLLTPRLNQLISGLQPGDISPVTFIDGRYYQARVISEQQLPAQPISEVSAEIRQLLAPQMVREAVKKASREAVAGVDIEYFN